ncbi:hypothetical protein F4604DRAFT_1883287 [Suillus subluteus]|nr:hypothetical protein F4604DRAFT_1883287 [Suillus subluteus]
MKAFVNCVLGYDASRKDIEGGILGLVKGYYGCVEAQGRGTLHCHMMIWLDGGLNLDEIKHRIIEQEDDDFVQRLLAFLDDSISNCIPLDPDSELSIPSSRHHPCSVHGISQDTAMDVDIEIARGKDLHHIASACQKHRHTTTCFKYWKGPPDLKQCASAKVILYYITDYITKSQLKAHRLLQKCAHTMISHQELSAQQVSSYLLDYEDHFTSHAFNNLHIDEQQPNSECQPDQTQDIQENCWQANEEVDEIMYDDERQEDERNWNEHIAEDNEDDDEVDPSQYMDYIFCGQELNELSLIQQRMSMRRNL